MSVKISVLQDQHAIVIEVTGRASTAVLLPEHTQARRQVEFLHTVEINRGRGPIKYVDSVGDALEWFAACA